MTFFILIAGFVLFVLNQQGVTNLPPWVAYGVIALGAAMLLFPTFFAGSLNRDVRDDEVDPSTRLNVCGCSGAVYMEVKRGFAKNKITQVPCSTANSAVIQNPKKYFVLGCV